MRGTQGKECIRWYKNKVCNIKNHPSPVIYIRFFIFAFLLWLCANARLLYSYHFIFSHSLSHAAPSFSFNNRIKRKYSQRTATASQCELSHGTQEKNYIQIRKIIWSDRYKIHGISVDIWKNIHLLFFLLRSVFLPLCMSPCRLLCRIYLSFFIHFVYILK